MWTQLIPACKADIAGSIGNQMGYNESKGGRNRQCQSFFSFLRNRTCNYIKEIEQVHQQKDSTAAMEQLALIRPEIQQYFQ